MKTFGWNFSRHSENWWEIAATENVTHLWNASRVVQSRLYDGLWFFECTLARLDTAKPVTCLCIRMFWYRQWTRLRIEVNDLEWMKLHSQSIAACGISIVASKHVRNAALWAFSTLCFVTMFLGKIPRHRRYQLNFPDWERALFLIQSGFLWLIHTFLLIRTSVTCKPNSFHKSPWCK